VDAAAFAKAWNADISAAAAGAAQVEPPGTSELIPVGELVVVPLKAGQAPSTAYDALKGVLKAFGTSRRKRSCRRRRLVMVIWWP